MYTAPTCNECSTCCVDKVAQASTSWLSSGFYQRQIMPVAAEHLLPLGAVLGLVCPAAFSPRSCPKLPQASASLGQSAG